jgi:hypothetical protein
MKFSIYSSNDAKVTVLKFEAKNVLHGRRAFLYSTKIYVTISCIIL